MGLRVLSALFLVLLVSFSLACSGSMVGRGASLGDDEYIMVASKMLCTQVHNTNTTLNYGTIQGAIDANETLNGHIITVTNGTYFEHVNVSKSITLVGQNAETTIIDGNETGDVVYVTAGDVNITGFTILNSGDYPYSGVHLDLCDNTSIGRNIVINSHNGIALDHCSGSIIEGNIVKNNTVDGIAISSSQNNYISNNEIEDNGNMGIELSAESYAHTIHHNNLTDNAGGIGVFNSYQNSISENLLDKNRIGIWLQNSNGNSITGNLLMDNAVGLWLIYSDTNYIYHNNFINSTENQANVGHSSGNVWDDGYPSGGNFWSDYGGVDNGKGFYQNETGGDGIGDTPYIIDGSDMDNYPLMFQFGTFSGFVSESYLDLLMRYAEPEGLAYWTGELESGGISKQGFIDDMLKCVEYRQKWRNRLFAALMYQSVFEKVPDQGGFDSYVSALDAGALTWEQLLDEWLVSSEWNMTYGELNNTQFVTRVYHSMLHREVDELALDYYAGVLEDCVLTRAQLMLVLYHSPEYQMVSSDEKLVYQLYIGLLRRVPEPEGYQYWLGELHSGVPRIDVISAFLEGIEYELIHVWT